MTNWGPTFGAPVRCVLFGAAIQAEVAGPGAIVSGEPCFSCAASDLELAAALRARRCLIHAAKAKDRRPRGDASEALSPDRSTKRGLNLGPSHPPGRRGRHPGRSLDGDHAGVCGVSVAAERAAAGLARRLPAAGGLFARHDDWPTQDEVVRAAGTGRSARRCAGCGSRCPGSQR